MATLTMDMSSYEIDRSDTLTYGDEILSAGWNPALDLQQYTESRQVMPADLIAVDSEMFIKKMHTIEGSAEVFLKKMYACQR